MPENSTHHLSTRSPRPRAVATEATHARRCACWQVRLYVSSATRRYAVPGGITCHRTEQDARQRAEHDLTVLRDYDQRRPYLVPDTCYVATVESPGTRITGYLLDQMTSIDWDGVTEALPSRLSTDQDFSLSTCQRTGFCPVIADDAIGPEYQDVARSKGHLVLLNGGSCV